MAKGRKILAKMIGILPSRFIKGVAVFALSVDLRIPFTQDHQVPPSVHTFSLTTLKQRPLRIFRLRAMTAVSS